RCSGNLVRHSRCLWTVVHRTAYCDRSIDGGVDDWLDGFAGRSIRRCSFGCSESCCRLLQRVRPGGTYVLSCSARDGDPLGDRAVKGDFVMNCFNHADVQSAAFCIRCGHALCTDCIRSVRGSIYCETCLADIVGSPAAAKVSEPGTTASSAKAAEDQ